MTKIILTVLFLPVTLCAMSQQLSYTDPAAAYSRILLEKSGEGSYQRISNYKVIGTAYLFGERINGNAYVSTGKTEGHPISYNTYTQSLDVYETKSDNPVRVANVDVDSFRMIASGKSEFSEDLVFINSKYVDPSSKPKMLQVVHSGERFSLYKAYKSNLGMVSTNYIQSELRQFDLTYEYYYSDAKKPELKKLKATRNNLKSTFKEIADLSLLLEGDAFDTRLEFVLIQVFNALNNT